MKQIINDKYNKKEVIKPVEVKVKEEAPRELPLWHNEKLKLNAQTKAFMKELLFGAESKVDISIRKVFIILEDHIDKEKKLGNTRIDLRRDIYLFNRKAEGMNFTAIGKVLGISKEAVRKNYIKAVERLNRDEVREKVAITSTMVQ